MIARSWDLALATSNTDRLLIKAAVDIATGMGKRTIDRPARDPRGFRALVLGSQLSSKAFSARHGRFAAEASRPLWSTWLLSARSSSHAQPAGLEQMQNEVGPLVAHGSAGTPDTHAARRVG